MSKSFLTNTVDPKVQNKILILNLKHFFWPNFEFYNFFDQIFLGCALAQFADEASMQKALALHDYEIEGRKIGIREDREKDKKSKFVHNFSLISNNIKKKSNFRILFFWIFRSILVTFQKIFLFSTSMKTLNLWSQKMFKSERIMQSLYSRLLKMLMVFCSFLQKQEFFINILILSLQIWFFIKTACVQQLNGKIINDKPLDVHLDKRSPKFWNKFIENESETSWNSRVLKF